MPEYTQEKHLLQIHTPLGKDTLLLADLTGTESISHLFHFSVDLLSENHSISFKDIVGKQVTISILNGDGKRFWNGYISRFACTGGDNRFSSYRAEIVPWLWFLSRTADCQIFQQKTIPEIIKKVFQDHGFQDFQDRTQGSYPQREYVVQYRETAFNFVSRLMEEYGIFYFFEHDQSSHKLILADKPQVHKNCPVQHKVRFNYTPGTTVLQEDIVESWGAEQELRPGKYALTDYNFQTPNTSLMANVQTIDELGGNTKYEIYDYPGIHTKKSEGDTVTKLRMEEEEALHHVITGSGGCRSFATGYKFNLDEHSRKDQNGDYLLTEITHSASVGDSYSGTGAGNHETYSNHFTCIPFAVPFRPQRFTPKPIVQGPQTAVVVGPAGEEIYPDKYGRVKVQFHWDRLGKKDENSSCWVRVSQPWAGKNWGAINIPRIGQEVIVEFLEGDPDRPIITGRVYNDDQMPPHPLPDNKTRTTFMSRSTKGGGTSNCNEITFEDKKGSEDLLIHAENTMHNSVEASQFITVGVDRHITTGSTDKSGGKHGDVLELVHNNHNLHVMADKKEKVDGDKHAQVTGDHNEKVTGNVSLQVGQTLQEKTGQKFAHDAGQEIHLKAGMKVIIEAGTQLTIKGAGGFVDIGPSGVTIQGTMVLINSGGAAGSGSGSSPKDPKDPDPP